MYVCMTIIYGITYGVSPYLFTLIWNPLYLTSTQATKSQLEWSQLKIYKI